MDLVKHGEPALVIRELLPKIPTAKEYADLTELWEAIVTKLQELKGMSPKSVNLSDLVLISSKLADVGYTDERHWTFLINVALLSSISDKNVQCYIKIRNNYMRIMQSFDSEQRQYNIVKLEEHASNLMFNFSSKRNYLLYPRQWNDDCHDLRRWIPKFSTKNDKS